ncbi:unnamed protein product (macronuclear) [Paramecium tetraurelia]|uniref:Uncharacterized protein n=1 Tax=Paramecium tetraurelia TaxID=5888 RepID=A0C8Z0_PARTE|nr:uncharacterized protein GSPATT00036393001 [Paramecium tetraurelia]CAK67257.1 unnamed protein product [Paramecium tetraurelia]|eukprot:XP_001434654.1 hypothetical protein (macronuclear) [Paramecium tetraurelia strain d4-2]
MVNDDMNEPILKMLFIGRTQFKEGETVEQLFQEYPRILAGRKEITIKRSIRISIQGLNQMRISKLQYSEGSSLLINPKIEVIDNKVEKHFSNSFQNRFFLNQNITKEPIRFEQEKPN